MLTRTPPDLFLPLTMLTRYLFFLSRRPISSSNTHYRSRRIAALQSLAPLLEGRDTPELERVAAQVRALTPANLLYAAPEIWQPLKTYAPKTVPRDVVVSQAPPPAAFFAGVRRALLVFAPGIGIGDEMICFPLPRWLRRALPGVDLHVLSAYQGVWDRVEGVTGAETYRDLRTMIARMRQAEPSFDLVFLADFEPPGLAPALCRESFLTRYVELSLGTRSLAALDNHERLLCHMPAADPYFHNYYRWFDHALGWLRPDLPVERAGLMRPSDGTTRKPEFVIVASPFTSKEEPSERYWARLLRHVTPAELDVPVRIVIDTGASRADALFAERLSRASAAQSHPALRCETAASDHGPNATLDEMLRHIEAADVLIAADSFSAHAGPLFDRLTFVIAAERLESWRAPSLNSFYFRASDDAEAVAAAIRRLIRETACPPRRNPDGAALTQCTGGVRALLDEEGSSFSAVSSGWRELFERYHAVADSLADWPEEYQPLCSDQDYRTLLTAAPRGDAGDWRTHLRNRLSEWENSNLCKYLGRLRG